MTATFGASVGMIMCIRMVASGWDFCFPPWATCLGYATFGLVSIMPLPAPLDSSPTPTPPPVAAVHHRRRYPPLIFCTVQRRPPSTSWDLLPAAPPHFLVATSKTRSDHPAALLPSPPVASLHRALLPLRQLGAQVRPRAHHRQHQVPPRRQGRAGQQECRHQVRRLPLQRGGAHVRFNTFLHAGKLKSVGRGTRAEPFVASLLGYGCSLLLTLMNKWEVNESVWINGIGVSINFIYLALFLICADNTNGRWIAPVISVLGATLFFGLTMVVGLLFESIVAVQCLCMLSGLASACAPLIIVLFVVGRYLENLPDCFSSSVGLLYYTVWATFPQQEYFDWIPNATGALLSAGFLYLLFEWRNQHEPAAGQENEPLLNEQNETLIEVIQEGMAPKETAPAVHPEENRAATELPPVENTQDTVMDPEKPAAAVHPEENRAATEQPQVENTQNPVIHPKETAPAVHPEENRAATEQPPVENTKDTVMDPEKPAAAGPLEENLAGTKQPQVENTQDSVDPQQPPVDPQQPVNAQDPADQ